MVGGTLGWVQLTVVGTASLSLSLFQVEVVRSTPTEFRLHLADRCYVHLRAESNVVRDIIVLTLRAFCGWLVASEAADRLTTPATTGGGLGNPTLQDLDNDDSLLLDAEALIVNAMKIAPVEASELVLITDSALDGSRSFEEALRTFQTMDFEDSTEATGVTAQYAALVGAMQRELREAKRRIAALTHQLDEKSEENAAFRGDIRTLQSALTAVQVADKVNEQVADDLKQLVQSERTLRGASDVDAAMPRKPLPENYY